MRTENDLRHALEHGQLEVLYQPIVSLRDGDAAPASRRCCAGTTRAAATCRPTEFIPIAEDSGLIGAIGRGCCARRRRRHASGAAAAARTAGR